MSKRNPVAFIVLAAAGCALSQPVASAELSLALNPLQLVPGAPETAPACVPDAGLAGGTLGARAAGPCHVGLLGDGFGVFARDPDDPEAALTADFTSGTFADGLVLLGPMTLRVHIMYDPVGCGGTACYPLQASLGFMLEELRADGVAIGLAAHAFVVPNNGLLSYLAGTVASVHVGSHRVAPGSRLRLRLFAREFVFPECDPDLASRECLPPTEPPTPTLSSAAARLLYGGAADGDYAVGDSAVTFAVADAVAVPDADPEVPAVAPDADDGSAGDPAPGAAGGGFALPALFLLFVAALRRRPGDVARTHSPARAS